MASAVKILYGSETGTAEDIAERIGRELQRRHVRVEVLAMNEYHWDALFQDQFMIFVCSTTGQGQEPSNMQLPLDFLSHWRFSIFGLGDSSYAKFNFVGKRLHKRLLQLGAQCILDRGDGDDQHYLGLYGAFDPWLGRLLPLLSQAFPSAEAPLDASVLLPPAVRLVQSEGKATGPTDGRESADPNKQLSDTVKPNGTDMPSWSCERPFLSRVLTNRRLTSADHFQDERHLELDIHVTSDNQSGVSFEAGDVLCLRPQNPSDLVQRLLDLLQWSDLADHEFVVEPDSKSIKRLPVWIPRKATLRQWMTQCVEPFSSPRSRYPFELLIHFSMDTTHKEKLMEWCTPEGQDDLFNYCHRPRRTLLEIIEDFQPLRIPIDYLFDFFPAMRPREFSISSKPSSAQLSITYGVVRYRTQLKAERLGVGTHYLARLCEGDPLPIWIKKGTMRLPAPATPVIFIGPGLGLAPMLSFLQFRIETQGATTNILFYGCRYRDKDYLYRQQLEAWQQQGVLQLFVAVSREEPKRYVQDEMKAEAKMLWKWLEQDGAYVYVSGNAKQMPDDVRQAWIDIILDQGAMSSPHAAADYFDRLVRTGRFQQETWS